MSSLSRIPEQLGNEPPQVVERAVREVKCPNPSCTLKLDITAIDSGTTIKCQGCSNVTWAPLYENKWWQKIKGFILSLLLSFTIGICGSLAASVIYDSYKSTEEPKRIMTIEGSVAPSEARTG